MKRTYPTGTTPRKLPLDEMNIRQLKAQARLFTGTTRPIQNYSLMDSKDLYREILDRWADAPVEVPAKRLLQGSTFSLWRSPQPQNPNNFL